MESILINSQEHSLYPAFKNLYTISFPIFEQRTEEQQQEAFLSSHYHLAAYKEADVFIGFIAYWQFQTYVYIEHYAINQTLRGKGYGTAVLSKFIADFSKTVILEIDPISDKISAARLRFYQHCGFYENTYPHIHPAYRKEYKAHSLIVLSTKSTLTKNEYEQFNTDLTNLIMKS